MSELVFAELMTRVRAGDQGAAAELVGLYEPTIRRIVRLRLGGRDLGGMLDSLDICQSVLFSFFVRAASGGYELDGPEQLVKLLAAMARNKLASHARMQLRQCRDRRRLQAGLGEGEVEPAAPGGTPSARVSAGELLQEAQRRLTAEEKRLVDLRAEGLEWADIAARLGGGAEALRKKLARALDRVAGELGLDEP